MRRPEAAGGGWEAMTRQSHGRVESGPPDASPGEPEHLRLLADWLDDSKQVHPSNLRTTYDGFEILMGLVASVHQLTIGDERIDVVVVGWL